MGLARHTQTVWSAEAVTKTCTSLPSSPVARDGGNEYPRGEAAMDQTASVCPAKVVTGNPSRAATNRGRRPKGSNTDTTGKKWGVQAFLGSQTQFERERGS